MAGTTKLLTAGGGGVNLTPASSIASDVTVNLPVTGINNGTLVCSDSSGNVGIGTSSPSDKLEVVGPIKAGSGAGGAGGFKQKYSADAASRSWWLSADVNAYGDFCFQQSTTQTGSTYATKMMLDSSGNLLVGKTIYGANQAGLEFAKELNDNGVLASYATTTAGRVRFGMYSNGLQVGYIYTSGSSTTYSTSSDYRLKENIQPMQNALDKVAQLNPVTYTWKADGSDGQGFIAHELQAVVPDCVTGEKDAVDEEGNPVYQGIDTSFLVATLTKAIQEQQVQIETLTAKVAALEAK